MCGTGAAVRQGGACSNVKRVIKAIVDLRTYAFLHFYTEEVLMAQHGYPDIMSHLTQHDEYLFTIKAFRQDLGACSGKDSEEFAVLAKKIAEYAADWWGQHILNVDARYATFIKEQKAG